MKKRSSLDQQIEAEKQQREAAQAELSLRLRQQEAIAWLGEYALANRDLGALFEQAAGLTARTLDMEYSKVLELLPGEESLLLRAGVGWKDGLVGNTRLGAGRDSQAGYTLLTGEPVIVGDLRSEARFSCPPLLAEHNVISGLSVVIPGQKQPYGVLSAHTTRLRQFSEHDAGFLKSIATILASAVERFAMEEALRNSRDELSIILGSISEGITVQDRSGKLAYANQAAAGILGYGTPEEALSAELSELMGKFEMLDEAGNPFPNDLLPGRLALQGVQKVSARVRFRVRETGEERWSIVEASPINGPDGRINQTVNIFRDITEIIRTQQAQELLARAGELLATSLDYETTLKNIVELAVVNLADWCSAYLVNEKGQAYEVAVSHKDPSKVELVRAIEERYPPDWKLKGELPEVLRTGKPIYIPEVTDEMLAAGARDEEHLRLIRLLGLRSGFAVPLIARGRALGSISFAWAESNRLYGQAETQLAHELARRAALAIDNARLYQESQAFNSELELRVTKRTRQLEESYRQLTQEVLERQKVESALRKSEAMLNSLFESAPDATILVDAEGKIVRVNRRMEEVFGYEREELLGSSIERLIPSQVKMRHAHYRQAYNDMRAVRPMGAGFDLTAVRKDGSLLPVDIMLSPVETEAGQFVISAIRDITEQKRLQNELAETHRRLFESIEEERLSLSRELHDGPIQELYGVALYLEGLRDTLQDSGDLEALDSTKGTIQSAIQMLRTVCGELRPPTLDQFGLDKAIRSHLIALRQKHPELEIVADLDSDDHRLSARASLALFRVYQSSVNNIVRHAQASRMEVRFSIDEEQAHLTVRDNGRGFEIPEK